MSAKFSIRELLLFIFIVALATSWVIKAVENERLRSLLAKVQNLKQQLEIESSRLATCEIEMDHFGALANVSVETTDVVLDVHRRKSASNLRIAEIQFEMDRLLDHAEESDLDLRRIEILNADVAESSKILANLKSNPQSSANQVKQANQQLSYFKTQVEKIVK